MSKIIVGSVKIKSTCTQHLKDNLDRILILFSAILCEKSTTDNTRINTKDNFIEFDVLLSLPSDVDRSVSPDFISRLQKYVDDICVEGCLSGIGGEDSSYDSDYEADPAPTLSRHHQDVSRTTSDTLAAEYAEYVQSNVHQLPLGVQDATPGYTARVEFALKLGYTERNVQAAIQKLGSSPTQDELLGELIKLGALKSGSCDSSPIDGALDVVEQFEAAASVAVSIDGSHYLRPIVIDGSNVAMSHGNKEIFSCRGIKICVDWFRGRGHKNITVFVPKWRKEAPRPDNAIRDQEILADLEKDRLLVFTPSRLVGGRRMVCYDDRYILKLAIQNDGIVVSNDNYRDLCQENAEYRKVVEERILMYSFVNDHFMPPDDPLGRGGPTLDNFLRYQPKKGEPPPPPCPYAKKCTYGNKCKYHHPERGPLPHKSVTERLSEHAQRHLQAREGEIRKIPLGRTRSNVPPPKDQPQHAIVSKSRSVDNVGTCYQHQPLNVVVAPPAPENLHRKLQRQLTLNPGSDPRLAPGGNSNRLYGTSPGPMKATYLTQPGAWNMHQHVTRIASAPDSYRPWPPQQQSSATSPLQATTQSHQHAAHTQMQRISSCSDSHLNLWPPPLPTSTIWSPAGSGTTNATPNTQEEARRKLHYHLTALFPEEQVLQAMQMYPDETNAQKICAAILSMFPKA